MRPLFQGQCLPEVAGKDCGAGDCDGTGHGEDGSPSGNCRIYGEGGRQPLGYWEALLCSGVGDQADQ